MDFLAYQLRGIECAMTEENTAPITTNPYKCYAPGMQSQYEGQPCERRLNKHISEKNNWINNTTEEQLIGTLKYHNLDTHGSVDILRKRLKVFMRKQLTACNTGIPIQTAESFYSYYLIIDFEATCEDYNAADYQHEIIEFPVILYDAVLHKTVDVFHAYCRPVLNPCLSDFCRSLTKIDQETVNYARPFHEVLQQVDDWMRKHRLFDHKFAVVCDCNADMGKFMRIQCDISGLEMPLWAHQWINVRKAFRSFYQMPQDSKLSMKKMLSCLGLEFEGQQHSGLNDAQNILRIVELMMKDGCELRVNEKFDLSFQPHCTSSVSRKEAENSAFVSWGFRGGRGDPGSSTLWQQSDTLPIVMSAVDQGLGTIRLTDGFEVPYQLR